MNTLKNKQISKEEDHIDELINMLICLQDNVKACLENGSSPLLEFTIDKHFETVIEKAKEIKNDYI